MPFKTMPFSSFSFAGPGRASLLLSALLLAPALGRAQGTAPTPGQAATGSAGEAKNELETLSAVEVSAARVKPFSTANVDLPRTIDDIQPYFMFEASTIERSGATTLENFLHQRLTMNSQQTLQEQSFLNSGMPSAVNLRGLGTGHTLILINGRRSTGGNVAGAGNAQPDINNIPLGAVDRIEVLTASSSAIYGANAIGGVINIVLKRNYAGGEVRTTYQNTFDSDTPVRRADLTYGFSLEKGRTQVMLTANFGDTDVLRFQDRQGILHPYSLRVMKNAPIYASYLLMGSTPNIVAAAGPSAALTLKSGGSLNAYNTYIPAGTAPGVTPAALAAGLLANAGQQNHNPADTTQFKGLRGLLGTPSSTRSFRASVRREMTSRLEWFTDFSYGATRTDKDDWSVATTLAVPANSPINPFNQAVNLAVPFKTKSPSATQSLTRTFTTGVLAKLPYHWLGHADYTWSQGYNSYVSSASGYNNAELAAAILAGTVNPFVDTQQYPLALAPYLSYSKWFGYGTLNDVNLRLSGPVWRLPGGAPQLTIGLGRRQEGTASAPTYVDVPNFPARNTATMTLGKKQITESLYAEANLPIIGETNRRWFARQLDLQFAARTEQFQVNTGTASITLLPAPATPPVIRNNPAKYKSTKPTAGFSYKPIDDVMFRASYSSGFVPPSYGQLLLNPTPSTNLTTVVDPRRGNTGRAVPTLSGGNPDLTPEDSKTWNVGLIIAPKSIALLRGLRINLEYYSIEKRNNIGTIGAQTLVENEALFPDRVVRDPVPAGDPYGVGPITLLNLRSMNLFKAYNEGYDLSASYSRRTEALGGFEFSFNTSLPKHYKRKTVANQPYLDYVNFAGSGPLAFRYNTSFVWDYRGWSLGWNTRYYGKSRVSGPPINTSLLTIQATGSDANPQQSYHDLLLGYRFGPKTARVKDPLNLLKGLELQLGILNVFNHEPPFDVAASSFWYSTWGNLRLREYRLSVKKAF